jgi:gas vesicle protein
MSENRGDSLGWFLFGLLLGGLIGAAITLFYTPKTGEEMQEELRVRRTALRERVGEITEKTRERIEELREQIARLQSGEDVVEIEIEEAAEIEEAEETA